MSQTQQDRLQPMPENYSEYSFNPEVTVEGVVSPEQLGRSIDFKPEYLRGLVQDATSGVALSDQSRGEPLVGISHEGEVIITPQSVADLASQVASETVRLRHEEINHEMRSQN